MRQVKPDQLNACYVAIAVNSHRYPIRFFAGYGKNKMIKTAWSMAGAVLLTQADAQTVVSRCAAKGRSAHIMILSTEPVDNL